MGVALAVEMLQPFGRGDAVLDGVAGHAAARLLGVEGDDAGLPVLLLLGLEDIGGALVAREQIPAVLGVEEAAERGVFGAPSFLLGESLFFGNDRLDFVREQLAEA